MSAHLREAWRKAAMKASPENPYLGPKVKCTTGRCAGRNNYTTNINGICSRHPEGNKNLGKAIAWERDNKSALRLASLPEPWRSNYDAQWSDLVPVSFLDSIKEIDREGEGAHLDRITESIAEIGFTDPVIIEVRPFEGGMDDDFVKVLLIEGNHRLAAAKRLGLSHVPAKVLFHDSYRDQGVGLSKPRGMFINMTFREGWMGSGFKSPLSVFDL